MAAKKGGLGRGLDALFADAVPLDESEDTTEESRTAGTKARAKKAETQADEKDRVKYIKVLDIKPNENQPRKTFNEEKIAELADSIKEHGLIQPIIVRKTRAGYEIVAGERRWRASIKAGLEKIPCIIRELTDEQNMFFAIIENMQREDLNPIEEAEGLEQMSRTFGMTQEQISRSVGKSRPYIANSLRLLKLPEYVKKEVTEGNISAAHARTIITLEDESKRKTLLEKIIREGLSVRETEKEVQEILKHKKEAKKKVKTKNADLLKVEAELKESLGTRVSINQRGRKGKIEIEYFSKDELERLIELLKSLA